MSEQTIFLSDDQLFYTLEGEGEYIGRPSVFMRMSMCNLSCIGFKSEAAPFGCDSYVSWSVKNKMTFQQVWDTFFVGQGYANRLAHGGAILKLTGGEPLIQQKRLIEFIDWISDQDERLIMGMGLNVDFETNATLMPDPFWTNNGATFTTSPKLTTNGDPESQTYKPEVLRYHSDIGSGFKFVVSTEADIEEIKRKYMDDENGINVKNDRIWLMPACGSRQEHIERAPKVAEWAKELGVNFSPRLHLLIWDLALRV